MDIFIRFDLDADHILVAGFDQGLHFFLRKSQRVAHLHTGGCIILEIGNFLPFGFQLLRCVERDISMTGLQQLIDILFINISALTLTVRAVLASKTDTFVELDSQPGKRFYNIGLRPGNEALRVGIFDTENQISTILFGKQIIV